MEGTTKTPCGLQPYLECFLLATIYVASLYVWRTTEGRKHPSVIKRRFLSVTLVTLLSPLYVLYFVDERVLQGNSLWVVLGLRLDGVVLAALLPLLLTAVLFLGPISLLYFNEFNVYTDYRSWLSNVDLIWLRNYVVAPITEEFTFRACMLALLLHCLEPKPAIFICPVFFGTAHLHHIVEQVREGIPLKFVLLSAGFQFTYTSVFGAYSAYLFLRTGHLIAPVLCHAFCNHMGAPDFGAVMELPSRQRIASILCFIGGLAAWFLLVKPMTDPGQYNNQLSWAGRIHASDI